LRLVCDAVSATAVSDLFTIDPTTGEIRTNRSLAGYSRPSSYRLNVSAEGYNPPRVNFTDVTVRILNGSSGDIRPFFIRPDRDGRQFSFLEVRREVCTVPRSNVTFDAHSTSNGRRMGVESYF